MKTKIEKMIEGCSHDFRFVHVVEESTQTTSLYTKFAYSVCKRCGEVRKNRI